MIDESEGVISDIDGGDVSDVDIATLRRVRDEMSYLGDD